MPSFPLSSSSKLIWSTNTVLYFSIHIFKIASVYRLFKDTPRTQKHFAKFAGVAVDALSGNAEYNKQVALVADRLDVIIAAMDDKLQLLGNINYMKYSHIQRGIPRETFEVIIDFTQLLIKFSILINAVIYQFRTSAAFFLRA